MPKIKPVIKPEHGQVTAYTLEAVRILDQTLLDQRTIAITYVSVLIHQKFPMIPRETRRQVAARCLEKERQRRQDQQKNKENQNAKH